MFADAKRTSIPRREEVLPDALEHDTHFVCAGDDLPISTNGISPPRSRPMPAEDFITFLRSLHRVDRLIGDFYMELQRLGMAEDTWSS